MPKYINYSTLRDVILKKDLNFTDGFHFSNPAFVAESSLGTIVIGGDQCYHYSNLLPTQQVLLTETGFKFPSLISETAESEVNFNLIKLMEDIPALENVQSLIEFLEANPGVVMFIDEHKDGPEYPSTTFFFAPEDEDGYCMVPNIYYDMEGDPLYSSEWQDDEEPILVFPTSQVEVNGNKITIKCSSDDSDEVEMDVYLFKPITWDEALGKDITLLDS